MMYSRRIGPEVLRRIMGMPRLVSFKSDNIGGGPDIRETAGDYIRRYGNEAALIAWGVADGYALEGDSYNRDAWMLVMNAIESMAARNLKDGQRNHVSDFGP
jgi:hypothetical protein